MQGLQKSKLSAIHHYFKTKSYFTFLWEKNMVCSTHKQSPNHVPDNHRRLEIKLMIAIFNLSLGVPWNSAFLGLVQINQTLPHPHLPKCFLHELPISWQKAQLFISKSLLEHHLALVGMDDRQGWLHRQHTLLQDTAVKKSSYKTINQVSMPAFCKID